MIASPLGLNGRLRRLPELASRNESWLLPAALGGISLLLLAVLVLPERTYSGNYTNDLMTFFDSGYRLLHGQAPNRDFHTPLGALTVLLPAFGLWMAGLGGMMPWATAGFTLIFLPFLLYVCRSRLPLLYATGFGAYALLLVIGPVNVGEQVDQTSFAMFYNRWGYAALSALFLLALPPRGSGGAKALDAAAAGGLLLLMFYLKVSYFLLALVFLVGVTLLERRLWLLLGLVGAVAAIGLIDIFWKGTATYLSDIRTAADASGALRGTLFTLSRIVLLNFMAVIVFLGVIGIAAARGVSWRILLLCMYMAAAGVLLVNQNAQMVGILTLVPAAIVAAVAPGVREERIDPRWPDLASMILIAALVIPTATTSLVATGYFIAKSMRVQSDGPYQASLNGIIAEEGAADVFKVGPDVQRAAYRSQRPTLDMYSKIRNQRFKQVFSQPEYLRTIADGARLLQGDPRLRGKVFVLDMANPFNALLGREPPRGVDAWNHNGRTLTERSFRPAEAMFADVEVVMVPKMPSELSTRQVLEVVYGGYLRSKFEMAAVSDYWWAYRRRP